MLSPDGGSSVCILVVTPGSGGLAGHPGGIRHCVAGEFAREAEAEGGSELYSQLGSGIPFGAAQSSGARGGGGGDLP